VPDQRVLFLGDSLVAGFGDPSGLGWTGRVVAASFAAALPVSAYNLGVRRQTSRQIGSRWREEALPRLAPRADCRMVLSFGANDTTKEHGSMRVNFPSSLGTLAAILDDAASMGLRTLVIGPAPVQDREQSERIQRLSTAFGKLCRAQAIPFVDVIEPLLSSPVWMAQVTAGDGAHPAAEGYGVLADLILAGGWLDWLRQAQRPHIHAG
jgi:acyl-CoA thioesterase-1